MNILALDFGTKNIGLAWADTGIGTALPFGVINNTDLEKRNRELDKLVERERIDRIVIGLPLGMDGKENENTERVRRFAKDLESFLPVPVYFFDERLSSYEADRSPDTGVSRDEKSAVVILNAYLETLK